MGKVYQPIVVEESKNLLQGLIESKFFEDYEIDNLTFAEEYILEKMNQKYISGLLGDSENEEIFTEDEFEEMLRELVAGSVLHELKVSGYLDSYEDENTEETFFLTEKGKNYLKNKKSA